MPAKKHFRYKRGKTEIEGDSDIKDAVRLAYINTFMYWLFRIILAIGGGATINIVGKLLG